MPKIKRLREIIPLLEKGMSYAEVGQHFNVAESTVWLWARKLREGGFDIKTTKGRKFKKL